MTKGQARPRARERGIPFAGTPGPWNAITDVPGVVVGQITVDPSPEVPPERRHWVRTGVTVVLPRARSDAAPVMAAPFTLNGNGELTGAAWMEESGGLEGPVTLTNTDTVGLVRDSVIRWARDRGHSPDRWSLPVVGETWDGFLNDVAGRYLTEAHVRAALDGARDGPVAEGSVGAGTACVSYGYKGGIGTSSRTVEDPGPYRLGVLVQANHGRPGQLRVAGVDVAEHEGPSARSRPETGSIVVVIATDAPLLPHQLKRVARRGALGLGRSGSISGNGSGDFFIAFSTARSEPSDGAAVSRVAMLDNDRLDPLFEATVQATDEAILNALVAAETMVGYRDHKVEGFPVDRLSEWFPSSVR